MRVQSGTRISWCDLLRTNVILPHKILCSEILHIIPNRNNLSTATLQQEVTSLCGVESSALAAAQHLLSLIMSKQSCLFPRVCFCSYTAASRGVTALSARLRGEWTLRDVFLEIVSAEQLELLKHRVNMLARSLIPSFPSRLIADVALNNTKPDAQGSLANGPLVRKASIHRKTWLVASSPYSLPRVNSI